MVQKYYKELLIPILFGIGLYFMDMDISVSLPLWAAVAMCIVGIIYLEEKC
jgi:hypothetical protein